MARIEEKVEELIEESIKQLGYELYDVEYAKEGKHYFLRVFIDKEEGIDLEDCEKVSNEINPLLDQENIVKEQYFLEVSSPGIERILRKEKHLQENIGKEVQINLFKAIDKTKQIEGKLKSYTQTEIIIEKGEKDFSIERKNIALIKTKYNW